MTFPFGTELDLKLLPGKKNIIMDGCILFGYFLTFRVPPMPEVFTFYIPSTRWVNDPVKLNSVQTPVKNTPKILEQVKKSSKYITQVEMLVEIGLAR